MNQHACDTPARIAIVGAGPLGIEAALYARFLGYDAVVYEREAIAAAVATLAGGEGASQIAGDFANLHSSLGLAAIESQDENYIPPANHEAITHAQWLDRYLNPLAATDLFEGCLQVGCEVARIGPIAADVDATHEADEPAPDQFSLEILDREGRGQTDRVAVVIDTTGAGLREAPRRRLSGRRAMAIDFEVPHPHYHLLGLNARGSAPITFLEGLAQIRVLFSLIGDRDELDLYAGARSLLKPR